MFVIEVKLFNHLLNTCSELIFSLRSSFYTPEKQRPKIGSVIAPKQTFESTRITDLRSLVFILHPCSGVCIKRRPKIGSDNASKQTFESMRITDFRSLVFVLYTHSSVCIKRRPKTLFKKDNSFLKFCSFILLLSVFPMNTYFHPFFYNIKHNISLLNMCPRSSVFNLWSSFCEHPYIEWVQDWYQCDNVLPFTDCLHQLPNG